MNLQYLIQVLQNKITILSNAKSQALSVGDLDQMVQIDKDLLETQNTFSQLTALVDINQMASAANTTPTNLVANSLQTVQAPVQGPSASAIVNGFDISAYATDPYHEQKIQNIVNQIPVFTSVSQINSYIQSVAPSSPVTGDMTYTAALSYSVDLPLLLAIMQNDSNFGMLGVGARTYNPGNVGNTGFSERSYSSWDEGVMAVASWLNDHRASDTPTIVPTLQLDTQQKPIVPEPVVPPVVPPVIPPTPTPTPEPIPEPVVPPIIPPVIPPVIPEPITPTPDIIDLPVQDVTPIRETVIEEVPAKVLQRESVSMDGVRKVKSTLAGKRTIKRNRG